VISATGCIGEDSKRLAVLGRRGDVQLHSDLGRTIFGRVDCHVMRGEWPYPLRRWTSAITGDGLHGSKIESRANRWAAVIVMAFTLGRGAIVAAGTLIT